MLQSRDGEPHDRERTSVLLVDDEHEFVDTLSKRLAARGFQVAVAYDGEQALAAVAEQGYHAMILDLKMPGMDGIEVLQRIRQERHAIKVIILTGHGAAEEEQTARALGAFEYLHKPADIDVLVDAMQRARSALNPAPAGP
jgi:two-component system response regulator CpxR